MTLIPVYFEIDGEQSKALVEADKVGFYLNLGAKEISYTKRPKVRKVRIVGPRSPIRTVGPRTSSKPVPVSIENSAQILNRKAELIAFHKAQINKLTVFNLIQNYVLKVTGKTITKKMDGTIDQYRRTAMRHIGRYIDAGIC